MILNADVIGLILGMVLTLLVFSYLLGDNPLYRLAVHLFIGALVGYAAGIVVREVGIKTVVAPLVESPGENLVVVVPILIGLSLFFFKSVRRLAYLGNYPLAYLLGVGMMVALSGALQGTLLPQIEATGQALDLTDPLNVWQSPFHGLLIVFGTVCTLLAFDFTITAQRRRGLSGVLGYLIGGLGWIGRTFFLTAAFGVAFAGALVASLTLFLGRVEYLVDIYRKVLEFLGG